MFSSWRDGEPGGGGGGGGVFSVQKQPAGQKCNQQAWEQTIKHDLAVTFGCELRSTQVDNISSPHLTAFS